MELDRVRGDARLPVLEVEEGDSDDAGLSAETQLAACLTHLTPAVGSRPARTCGRGRFRDHLIGARLDDDVEILVWLVTDKRHGGVDAPDVPLERKPGSWKRRWPLVADQLAHGDRVGSEQARAVLQRLHLPALDPARECSRVAKVAATRGRGDSCCQHRAGDDEYNRDNSSRPHTPLPRAAA
jgi:hypothetical protein